MKIITEEQIEFIDDLLSHFEDFTHGKIGNDISISRNILANLELHSYTEERKQDFVEEKCINYEKEN